jgi:beta-phosphoglucomutase
MLKAIVFDFDGVIVDSEPLHFRALRRVVEPLGITFDYPRYLGRYIGFDDRDSFRAILEDAGRPRSEATDQYIDQLCQEKGDAFEAIVHEGIQAFPGVVEFIASVGRDLPLAIASGATRRDIDLILGKLGLGGRFDPIVSADLVHRSKPHPQTYALAAEGLAKRRPELKIAPGDCVAVEDTAAGIESARGAGLWTLAVTNSHQAAELHRAHRVVKGLGGLGLDQLRTWFG